LSRGVPWPPEWSGRAARGVPSGDKVSGGLVTRERDIAPAIPLNHPLRSRSPMPKRGIATDLDLTRSPGHAPAERLVWASSELLLVAVRVHRNRDTHALHLCYR
jgi:hypothetical protein